MKSYTIEQVYFKYHNLRRKAHLKRMWNNEAKSYELNIERIRTASHLTLVSGLPLNDNDKVMLTIMSGGKS